MQHNNKHCDAVKYILTETSATASSSSKPSSPTNPPICMRVKKDNSEFCANVFFSENKNERRYERTSSAGSPPPASSPEPAASSPNPPKSSPLSLPN